MAEEKEAKRLAELEATRQKILAKYRAAGGEARELDLAAKEAADAARAEREAADYARKLDEDLRRRKVHISYVRYFVYAEIHILQQCAPEGGTFFFLTFRWYFA